MQVNCVKSFAHLIAIHSVSDLCPIRFDFFVVVAGQFTPVCLYLSLSDYTPLQTSAVLRRPLKLRVHHPLADEQLHGSWAKLRQASWQVTGMLPEEIRHENC